MVRRRREYSKLILAAVMAMFFVGVAVGGVVVLWLAPDQLPALLAFIGAPVATAIAFYYWKAKCENIVKLSDNERRAIGGAEADPADQ